LLKIFATQLSGLFKRIEENNEFSFEDGARLLAQAVLGDGSIYIYGVQEMAAVVAEATEGTEPFPSAKKWQEDIQLVPADRVILFARYSNEIHAVELAKKLIECGVPFVAISTATGGHEDLTTLADVHIDLNLSKGLISAENGMRVGYPSSMVALFVYYGLKFTVEEILAEI
jgi:hypothetical protein